MAGINVYGRAVYLTIISRRSNLFAGTRFLKRGANFKVKPFLISNPLMKKIVRKTTDIEKSQKDN